jgi:exopolysaccharide production protein ExoZ
MPAFPRSKFEGIQSLRFVAALLVVVTHSTFYAGERLDRSVQTWDFGAVGVDIFFVISGFVMVISTGALVGTKDGWKYFGMRRLVRIVPMYWIATTIKLLTLIALPAAVLHAQLDPGKTILSYLFLPSRNFEGRVEPLLGVGWTLTFEMFFYFVFTIALLLRTRPIWLCASVLSLCALGSVVRPDQWAPALVYLNPIVLYFLVGMIAGEWILSGSGRRFVTWMSYVVVLWLVIPLADGQFSGSDLSLLIRHISVAVLVIVAVAGDSWISGRVPKPVIYMGDASYSLYLFHPLMAPIVPVVLAMIGLRSGGLSVVLSILTALIGAALIFRFVERPITRYLQGNLPYMRRHAAATIEPDPVPDAVKP